jgi:hypothetical protein
MSPGILSTLSPIIREPPQPVNGGCVLLASQQLVALKYTSEKPLQPLKAAIPIDVTELPMVKLPVKPLHLRKAQVPIDVTEFPMFKLSEKPLQLAKASLPNVVTELGMLRSPVKPLHPLKA